MEGFGKRVWGKGEEDKINSILSEVIWTEVIWTEVIYILEVMLVEVSIRTVTTSVPISVSLPHLCLYPYLSLLLCPASEAPGPLASSQITGFLKNGATRVYCIHFPNCCPLCGHLGSLQAGLVSLDQQRLKAPRTPEPEAG